DAGARADPQQFAFGKVVDPLSVQENLAAVRTQQAETELEDDRLAGAALAEQQRGPAGRHAEAQVVENDVFVERERDVLEFDRRRHGSAAAALELVEQPPRQVDLLRLEAMDLVLLDRDPNPESTRLEVFGFVLHRAFPAVVTISDVHEKALVFQRVRECPVWSIEQSWIANHRREVLGIARSDVERAESAVRVAGDVHLADAIVAKHLIEECRKN